MGVRVRHHSKSGQSSSLSVKAVGGMSSGRIVTSDLAKYPYIGSNVAITLGSILSRCLGGSAMNASSYSRVVDVVR